MTLFHRVLGQPLALPLILVAGIAVAASSEQVTLEDGTTCTIIHSDNSEAGAAGGLSSSVTVGGGKVTSSTSVGGQTSTTTTGAGSTSSTAGSSASSGTTSSSSSSGGHAFSTASIVQPDGTIITRRSDGTCDITKPTK
ncbi:hypothetical protein ABID21_005042 [Pseudorhizobium tarimense]|uniref:Uncharacterized protein n=1 Tax=Pseudorhizobium tarimense TaxID=1079109 RepID=A0ABV2HER3_9HYPH|nr:hypothetical protein [Pseudorhizobium tarimense]MCJ8521865.1 hypothetical protein [Pseudorhizobium tarimense]